MLNTVRQVGSVLGTASVGALLQDRLVSSLSSQAAIASAGLPASVRGPFVSGFRQAAASGLLTGGAAAGSPGGSRSVPPGLAAQIRRLGAEVFTQGYVHAMRWTMVMPVAGPDSGQMAGTISSPGSSGAPGQSPGSSSGMPSSGMPSSGMPS